MYHHSTSTRSLYKIIFFEKLSVQIHISGYKGYKANLYVVYTYINVVMWCNKCIGAPNSGKELKQCVEGEHCSEGNVG